MFNPRPLATSHVTGSNIRGIALFSLGIFFQTILDTTAKWLTGNYAVPEIIFFRSLFALLPIALLIFLLGGTPALRIIRPWLHLLRGVLIIITITTFYVSLSHMRLPDAEAVFFTAPFFMTIFSVIFLKERITGIHWFVIAIGFFGATLILQPQSEVLGLLSLLPLFAAITYSLVMIVTSRLLKSDSTLSVIIYGNLILLAASAMILPVFWTTPETNDLWLFLFMGLIDGASVLCLTLALRQSPVSVLAPYDYTMLIWALIFSAIIWSELPDLITWAGIAIIVVAGLVSCRSEFAPGKSD
jgi:drug/metabolite transporter (DMT)-like permease